MKKLSIEAEDWTKEKCMYSVYIDNKYYQDLSFEMMLGMINKSILKKFKPK